MKSNSSKKLGLLLLLAALIAAGFRYQNGPARLGPVSPKTATALSSYFRKDFRPLNVAQIETMNAAAFDSWLRQSTLSVTQRKAIGQYLQPVRDGGTLEALVVRKARPLKGTGLTDVVLIQVPKDFRNQLQGASYVAIFTASGQGEGDPNQIETCQYNDCYCSGSGNGSCVTTTQFNRNCPPNECAAAGGTCDCGGDGGSNLDDVFQTLEG